VVVVVMMAFFFFLKAVLENVDRGRVRISQVFISPLIRGLVEKSSCESLNRAELIDRVTCNARIQCLPRGFTSFYISSEKKRKNQKPPTIT